MKKLFRRLTSKNTIQDLVFSPHNNPGKVLRIFYGRQNEQILLNQLREIQENLESNLLKGLKK